MASYVDDWIYQSPIVIVLLINSMFLVKIMWVSVVNNENSNGNDYRTHWEFYTMGSTVLFLFVQPSLTPGTRDARYPQNDPRQLYRRKVSDTSPHV